MRFDLHYLVTESHRPNRNPFRKRGTQVYAVVRS